MFVICSAGATATFNLPTDSAGNTYTMDKNGTHSNTKTNTYYSQNITGFTNGTVNCNTTSSKAMGVGIVEVSGVASASFDASQATINNGAASASPWTTGTLVTTNANDILITWLSNDLVSYTLTQPSGFTGLDISSVNGTAYKIVSGTQNNAYTWSGTPGTTDHMAAGVIAFKAAATATISGVTDSSSNTYSQSACSPKVVTGGAAALYYAPNIAAAGAGANTVTVAMSGSPSRRAIMALEYSGLATSPVDVCAGATGTGTAVSSGSLTTTVAGDLLTAGTNAVNTSITSPGAGFTQQISSGGSDVEDQTGVAIGSYTNAPTQAAANDWANIQAAWKASGTGGTTNFSFSVVCAGNGSGSVTASGISVNCSAGVPSGTQSTNVSANSTLTLSANPFSGTAFGNYSGAGCGTSPTCVTAAITTNTVVTATFNLSGTLNYYVNGSTGSNSNDGLAATTGGGHGPWLTIQKAATSLTLGAAGTAVNVADSTYTGPINMNFTGGTAARPIIFQSTNQYGAVITSASGGAFTVGSSIIKPTYVTIKNFAVTGTSNLCYGIVMWGSNNTASDNWVHDIPAPGQISPTGPCGDTKGGGGIVTGDDGTNGFNSALRNIVDNIGAGTTGHACNNQHGIYWSTPHGKIQNNIVSRACAVGIIFYHDTTDEIVSNNVVINNDEGGIQITAGTPVGSISCNDNTSVFNNIVANNGNGVSTNPGQAFAIGGISEASGCTGASNTYRNNWIYGNNPNPYQFPHGARTNSGSIFTGSNATAFINYTGNAKTGNYQSPAGSPAINGGVFGTCAPGGQTPCVPLNDFLLVTRPQGTAPDIGPYEVP